MIWIQCTVCGRKNKVNGINPDVPAVCDPCARAKIRRAKNPAPAGWKRKSGKQQKWEMRKSWRYDKVMISKSMLKRLQTMETHSVSGGAEPTKEK